MVVHQSEFVPVLWTFEDNARKFLAIETPLNGTRGGLFFSDLDKAKAFLLWLKKTKTNVNRGSTFSQDGYRLLINGVPIQQTDIDHLHVVSL